MDWRDDYLDDLYYSPHHDDFINSTGTIAKVPPYSTAQNK